MVSYNIVEAKMDTILLVDDHPVFRQGLLNLLEKEKDLKVVGEAKDGQIAIDMFRKLSPDIVVMDISMPNLDGIEATRQIMSEFPDAKVVALSVHSEKRFVRSMLESGVAGYILKECVPQEMIDGIRVILAGNVYLSKSISDIVVSDYSSILSDSGSITEIQVAPILQTKLHRPPVTADIIPRARLIEILEEGRNGALSLISAPAGYGKSIVASQWLASSSCPSAWVSLDESDNDLREFLMYFLAAVQNTFSSLILRTKSLLQASDLPPVKVLSRYLLNDLERVEEPFILVLDDYHLIKEEVVHELLIELLRHPSPMLHLVLSTRRDPPLPIVGLRAYGQLTELSVRDLRFTVEETAAFLDRSLRGPVDTDSAEVLEDRLEGWVTGLRLAVLSLGQKKEFERIISELKDSTHFVQDYLIKEVLQHVPPSFSRQLLQTSILDRFCAPLCDAMYLPNEEQPETEVDLTGQAFIDWLEETHLFIISLDEKRQWFRYHHLFQELLQDQLKQAMSPDGIATLHRNSSNWLAGKGYINEAIKHAIAGGAVESAAQIVEQNRQAILNSDSWFVFEKWLSMFPDTVIKQRPELLLARAWVCLQYFNLPEVPTIIDVVESLLGDTQEDEALHGEIDFFRGFILYFQNNSSLCLKHLNNALKRVPDTYHEIRSQIEIIRGLANQMQGRKEEAVHTLNDLLYHQRQTPSVRKTRLIVTLVYIHIISGELDEALVVNQQLYEFATEYKYFYPLSWSVYLMGLIHFYQNDLGGAINYFRQNVEDIEKLPHARAVVDNMAGLAFSYQAAYHMESATTTLHHMSEYVDSLNHPAYSMLFQSTQVRLSILQGEIGPAIGWLREDSPPVENMAWWLEIPSVTYCRALFAEGSDENLVKAETKLKELLKFNQKNHNVCYMIQILALLSVVYDKQGKTEEALDAAEQAIKLAQSGGFIRPFVEAGAPMSDLLKRLLKQKVAEDFIGRILTAFERESQPAVQQDLPDRHKVFAAATQSGPLFEDLTQRELEVLTYLEKGLSNKEIGAEMFLSALTVKKHLYNVYQKLAVNSRIAAISRARELGLLSRS